MEAASDAGLRSAMVGLGAVVALVGIWTWSFNKALITYAFGVVAVAGVALPDWEVFDRGFLEWTSPVPWIPRQDSEPIVNAPRCEFFFLAACSLLLYVVCS